MANPAQTFRLTLGRSLRAPAFALALICTLSMAALSPAHAQTLTVLHDFTGGGDGANPTAGLTFDAAGNLYGTTAAGGYNGGPCFNGGCGTVFRMKPAGEGWTLSTLYSFHQNDGWQPTASVIFGPDGALYGTTWKGGSYGNGQYGTVYRLRPPASLCRTVQCPWTETVLWEFMGSPDGKRPGLGDLVFDNSGHVYGTTEEGGAFSDGTVYDLTALSGGGWSETIDYNFGSSSAEGRFPVDGVIFDSTGNMYTTTVEGGLGGCGTVSQLVASPSGWIENVLYTFQCQSYWGPQGGLLFDSAGNLYGTAGATGTNGGGAVFELSPSNGAWAFSVLYSFAGRGGPIGSLIMDAAGNLYGTTHSDGAYGHGNVFKLSPSDSGWTYTSLHDFTGGSDGGEPYGQVLRDALGDLYGTAKDGGTSTACSFGCGVVWKITP